MNNMSNNRKSNSNNSFKCSEVYGNGMRSRGAANRDINYNQRDASRARNQNSKNNNGQNKYGKVNNTLQKNFNKALYEGMYAEKKIERNFDPRLQQINRAYNASKNQNNRVEQGKILNLRNSEPMSSSLNNKKRNNVSNRAKMVEEKTNGNSANSKIKKNGINAGSNMGNIRNTFNRNSIGDTYNKNSLNKNVKAERVQFNRNFNNVQEKKNRQTEKQTEKHEYTDIKNNSIQLDDGQEAFPKSIFVFITVAVMFVAALIYTVANNDGVENTVDKLVNKATQNKIVQKEDKGLDLRGELDASQFLADSREEDNVTSMFSSNAEASEQNKKSTVKTGDKTEETDKKKTTTTSKNETTQSNVTNNVTNNTSSNISNNNSNNTVNTNDNQSSNNSVSNEEEVDEDNEEVVEESPTPTFYMPLEVTGMLYHCSDGFASYGADTGFQRYTGFIKSGSGVRVPTKDVDGIWIDVRGTKVTDYIGYKNGSRINVVKINIEDAVSANVKTIYAIKGTYIPLGGSYRKKDGTSTFRNMFASEDVELIKVGI